jgi:hypothetical protein
VTFRFKAQCLNHYATACPVNRVWGIIYIDELYKLFKDSNTIQSTKIKTEVARTCKKEGYQFTLQEITSSPSWKTVDKKEGTRRG